MSRLSRLVRKISASLSQLQSSSVERYVIRSWFFVFSVDLISLSDRDFFWLGSFGPTVSAFSGSTVSAFLGSTVLAFSAGMSLDAFALLPFVAVGLAVPLGCRSVSIWSYLGAYLYVIIIFYEKTLEGWLAIVAG